MSETMTMTAPATATQAAPAETPDSIPAISKVLEDYDVHHSGPDRSTEDAFDRPAAAAPQNPPGWDVSHRRVPPYRPINRHLDQSQRFVFQNNGERAFISVLFTGVVINAFVARLWRATGGRINDTIFKYPLGGEM